ncbi:TatD family hydrolase [Bacteroidota bacterium]
MLPDIEKFVNIHAHRLASFPDEWVLTNLLVQDYPPDGYEEAQYSVGLHPWHIEKADTDLLLKKVELATENTKVLAIGETGLDKVIKTPLDQQIKVFEAQVNMAEQYDLAVIIHLVKAFNELKEFIKVHHPSAPMVIHGFRGGRKLADELLNNGFYISLGAALLNSEKLQEVAMSVPLTRLFLESDEDDIHIHDLYKKVAELREIPIELLKIRVCENALRVFKEPIEY